MKDIFKIALVIFIAGLYFLFFWPKPNVTQQANNLQNHSKSNNGDSSVDSLNNKDPVNSLPMDNIDNEIIIDLQGAIHRPGIYHLSLNSRLFQLLEKAGGLKDANISCINQAIILKDESKIVIPKINEPCDVNNTTNHLNNDLININTATVDELSSLPGIGSTRANQIINFRTENGNFNTINDLKKVNGIGDQTFLNLKTLITV